MTMASGKNILMLIDRYHPIIGGAQKNVHELNCRLVKVGFKVTVLTRKIYPNLPKKEKIDHVQVVRFGYSPLRILSKAICLIGITSYLIRSAREYDAVLCVPCVKLTDLLPAYLSFLFTKIPYLMRTTGLDGNFNALLSRSAISPEETIKKLFFPPILWRQVITHAAAVVVQSRIIQKRAARFGVTRTVLIPNGADIERFRPASQYERVKLRRKLNLPVEKILVISTGRYVVEKNQIALIKAAEYLKLHLDSHDFHILILGATEQKQILSTEAFLKNYVNKRQLGDYVTFFDDVTNVEDYLRASDIFVLPTTYEGMSNALLEAMSCGLPVIASNIPQVTCTFPQDQGIFFAATDIKTLAKHLKNLMSSKDRRDSYGGNLAMHVRKNFSNDRLSSRYSNLLQSIVRNPHSVLGPI